MAANKVVINLALNDESERLALRGRIETLRAAMPERASGQPTDVAGPDRAGHSSGALERAELLSDR
jgi:hypothetical protein